MSDFCPDGFVPTQEAIARAVERWFPEQFNQFVVAMESQPSSRPEGHIEQAVQAFPQWQVPGVSRHEWESIKGRTVHRLRNLLHQGKLKAYYFDDYGGHAVPREFWATAPADGVLRSGYYSPSGPQTRVLEWRTDYPLCLLESELDKLLREESSKRQRVRDSKIPELVEALRKLDHLSNRAAQLQALREQFPQLKITEAIFRKVRQQLPPREAGRKSRRES
jgi:hypothetical protein